jgi:hypothetical protein
MCRLDLDRHSGICWPHGGLAPGDSTMMAVHCLIVCWQMAAFGRESLGERWFWGREAADPVIPGHRLLRLRQQILADRARRSERPFGNAIEVLGRCPSQTLLTKNLRPLETPQSGVCLEDGDLPLGACSSQVGLTENVSHSIKQKLRPCPPHLLAANMI